jgi:hypothetical protein
MRNLAQLATKAQKLIADNSPVILTAIGVTGAVTTAYLAARASFKAAEILAENEMSNDPLEFREKAELTWTLYLPAVTTGLLTVVCIISANRISSRRAAALAAAYSLMDRTFSEYREKIIEKLGEKKEQAARDEIAQERLDRDPVGKREIIVTGTGNVLCYDAYTGRYFTSDMESIRKAQNDINEQIIHDHNASLSDFYEKIGLATTQVSEEVGWNLDKMLELSFSTGLSDDGRPCITISFEVSPARNFFRLV